MDARAATARDVRVRLAPLAGALLLGGVHWLALRTWRRLRAALTPGALER